MFILILMVVIILVMYCSWRNFKYFCYLGWGKYSYLVNEFLWKQIILDKMILEHDRMIEYGNDNPDPKQGCPWRSKALNFERRKLDFSDYSSLSIKISPVAAEEKDLRVKIQLTSGLDSTVVNRPQGLDPKPYHLSNNSITHILIPLQTFKDNGTDLHKVYRLVIHYGQCAFTEPLNATNNAKIDIEEISLK
ncbi:MAG: hypothetical protein PHW54_05115 [Candidatus Omnitrophica bacterium]|nr:hypothetical protein [Candidatus Omnitrophota bacterium]